ncbi:trypsin-like peptidase domain-containing protein [Streptomyces sp. NPDC001851]|uniref:VMAP-C domain-containing protein n=1 Tax=Streptomyces sp. NPDC001851 TaxID=3154529 RepID=UPI00331FB7B4
MTERYDGGAPDGSDAARLALRELVLAATVRIHRPGAGYAPDEPGGFLGSGFFVAPNWVLTCAHVVHAEEGGEVTVVYRTSPYEDPCAVPAEVAATLPEQAAPLVPGSWPAPDLALVRLREPVGHTCVYVSERPNPHFGGNRVYYAGWTGARGRLEILDGYLSVQGTISAWSPEEQVRLGQNDLPPGVSGGPVIDPVRGEVVGVLKSRADQGTGGTSIGVEQLRTLRAPTEAVGTAHAAARTSGSFPGAAQVSGPYPSGSPRNADQATGIHLGGSPRTGPQGGGPQEGGLQAGGSSRMGSQEGGLQAGGSSRVGSQEGGLHSGGSSRAGSQEGGLHSGGSSRVGSQEGGLHSGGSPRTGSQEGGLHPNGPHLSGPQPTGPQPTALHPDGPHLSGLRSTGPQPTGLQPTNLNPTNLNPTGPLPPTGTPQGDLYQAVFRAHDRYHRDRQQPSDSPAPTWADIQGELGARPGRTLSPHERGELLGRLADLPPPASTRALLGILAALPGFRLPSLVPAPRGWRDGLGVLYEHARQDGVRRLVIDYAMGILAADRDRTPSVHAAERALWDWVRHASTGLDSGYRTELARRRTELLGRTPPARPGHERADDDPGQAPAERPAPHPSPAPPGPSVLLVVERRGWEPDHCDWAVSVADPDGGTRLLHETQRTPLAGLDSQVAAPLTEAFRQCDEPGRPATLHVALPYLLLGTPVDDWRLRPDGVPLGVERPVLVRCSDRDQLPDEAAEGPGAWPPASWEAYDDEDGERRDRWRRLHVRQARAEVLDCDDGVRRPVPDTAALRGLAPHDVPVLCRLGDLRYESDPASLGRILRAGFGVAVWRRWRREPESVCGEFHRGAKTVVDDGHGVAQLPEVVHGLRRQVHAGLTEAYWAHGIALLYDDPHRPLPGAGDLLEAP